MSNAEHFKAVCSTCHLVVCLVLGTSSCGADTTTFSSSSNWLSCRTDAECKAAFGEAACSSERICVDANNEPIPRNRRSVDAPDSDAGEHSSELLQGNDAATSSSNDVADARAAETGVAASTQPDAGISDEVTSRPDAASGVADEEATRALCSSACNQTDPYVLPLALCEDWNVFRDDQSYEFCGSIPSGTCEVRCSEAVTRSSPECGDVLPAVISCVAADGLYASGTMTIPPPSSCLFAACQVQLLRMASACSHRQEEWQAATDRWLQSGITAYRFRLGESTIQVDGNDATVVAGEPLDSPPTIDDLFTTIEASLQTSEQPLVVTYDPMLGYPTRLLNYEIGGTENCASATETSISEFTVD